MVISDKQQKEKKKTENWMSKFTDWIIQLSHKLFHQNVFSENKRNYGRLLIHTCFHWNAFSKSNIIFFVSFFMSNINFFVSFSSYLNYEENCYFVLRFVILIEWSIWFRKLTIKENKSFDSFQFIKKYRLDPIKILMDLGLIMKI
jgi:hypothetical protein